jgi:hypothetical protein
MEKKDEMGGGGTRQGVSRQNTGVQYQYISGIYEPRH